MKLDVKIQDSISMSAQRHHSHEHHTSHGHNDHHHSHGHGHRPSRGHSHDNDDRRSSRRKMERTLSSPAALHHPRRQSSKASDTSVNAIRKKLVIVGDGECGKTSLLIVFSKDSFPEHYVPTVFETHVADIQVTNSLFCILQGSVSARAW